MLSSGGPSTFLKKLKMLALDFTGVLEVVLLLLTCLVPCRPSVGTLLFEFGRGARGFVELVRVDMLDVGDFRSDGVPCGGVGARPVDGCIGVAMFRSAFSRGVRNISVSSFARRLQEKEALAFCAPNVNSRNFNDDVLDIAKRKTPTATRSHVI